MNRKWWWRMKQDLSQLWWTTRLTIQGVVFPLICLQFVRTLLFPTGFDVMILFILFLFYLGFLFRYY